MFRESTHENAIVVEFESNVDSQKRKEKMDMYLTPNIQEVLVLDPQKAPNDITGLSDWVENKFDGFL